MFGLGYQELLHHPRHRPDPLRGPAPAGPRQVARLEREGVQEGRERDHQGRHRRRIDDDPPTTPKEEEKKA